MDIANKVIEKFAEYKEVPAADISTETTIAELGMDSLDAMNLIFELEEEFDLSIPDEDVFEMKTVGEIVKGVEQLIAKKETESAEAASE